MHPEVWPLGILKYLAPTNPSRGGADVGLGSRPLLGRCPGPCLACLWSGLAAMSSAQSFVRILGCASFGLSLPCFVWIKRVSLL